MRRVFRKRKNTALRGGKKKQRARDSRKNLGEKELEEQRQQGIEATGGEISTAMGVIAAGIEDFGARFAGGL